MGNRGAGARSGPELGAGLVENVGKNLRGLQRGVQLRMCNERSPRGMPGVLCAIWVSLLSARPMRCVHCAMESRFAARPAVYFTGVTLVAYEGLSPSACPPVLCAVTFHSFIHMLDEWM